MDGEKIEQAILSLEKSALGGDIESQAKIIELYMSTEDYDEAVRWSIIALKTITPFITSTYQSMPQMITDLSRSLQTEGLIVEKK